MMQKPGVLTRLKYSVSFFRHGWSQLPTKAASGSRLPLYWPAWREGQPQWQLVDYDAYAREGFNENAIVYSAIMYKARAVSAAPLRAYGGTFDEPELLPADHPLQQLAQRPNRWMSWAVLQGLAEVYFNLSGNSYSLVLRANSPATKIYICPDCGGVAFAGRGCLGCGAPGYDGVKSVPVYRAADLRHTCACCGRRVQGMRCYGCGAWAGTTSPLKATARTPITVFPLRPDRVYIVPSRTRDLMGFLYVPEGASVSDGVPLLPQDVAHVKLPNPLDPLDGLGYGLAPLSPSARSTDVDNELTRYLKLFFQNGAMPPGVLSFDVPMTPEDVAIARERWMEIYGGVDNWSDVAVLDQGGKYQRVGLSFDEMDFGVLDARNESRAVGPFGVPLTLIESRPELVQSTYSNKSTDRVMFWQDTMVPELRWFEVEYQYYLQGPKGEFIRFDLSQVPALASPPEEQQRRAGEAFKNGGITRNEYRAVLGVDPDPDGDVYLVPAMMVTAPAGKRPKAAREAAPAEPRDQEETQEGMPEAEDEAAEAESKKALPAEAKAAFWKANDAHAHAWEERFGEAAKRAFARDLKELKAIIRGRGKKSVKQAAWQETLLRAQDYLWAAGDQWREEFAPLISALVVERGETLNAQFGMQFDVRNLLAEEWFTTYKLKFAQDIMDTTKDDVSALLKQAMEKGWSIGEGQDALEVLFARWMDNADLTEEQLAWFENRMPPYRRELIARTETIRASAAGSDALYKDWGVQQKEWLATRDGRTRPDHIEADGQVVPIDGFFNVGGWPMRYPGDPDGPPSETCNCRCSLLPVIGETEAA